MEVGTSIIQRRGTILAAGVAQKFAADERDIPMIEYRDNPPLDGNQLNELFAASWNGHETRDFGPILERSLAYVAAFCEGRPIGFVNVATDGGEHAFLLDTTVHPDFQRQGIGTELVRRAVDLARKAGASWLHVDFEERLSSFYFDACGFKTTKAGLMRLD
jgi:GNAT superfamily N-acetyltransferase